MKTIPEPLNDDDEFRVVGAESFVEETRSPSNEGVAGHSLWKASLIESIGSRDYFDDQEGSASPGPTQSMWSNSIPPVTFKEFGRTPVRRGSGAFMWLLLMATIFALFLLFYPRIMLMFAGSEASSGPPVEDIPSDLDFDKPRYSNIPQEYLTPEPSASIKPKVQPARSVEVTKPKPKQAGPIVRKPSSLKQAKPKPKRKQVLPKPVDKPHKQNVSADASPDEPNKKEAKSSEQPSKPITKIYPSPYGN